VQQSGGKEQETLVETVHVNCVDPEKSKITMQGGKVELTGAKVAHRAEDFDYTARQRDWVLSREKKAYKVTVQSHSIVLDSVEPLDSETHYVKTDVLMPGSIGVYNTTFKIPEAWRMEKKLRFKVSALSVRSNLSGLASNAANGESELLTYVLDEKSGQLVLQQPTQANGVTANAIKSGLIANATAASTLDMELFVHDLNVGHRVYDGWDGQKWLDIVLHNYAAFDDDIKLACAVYVDGSKNPTYVNLPYYENATLSHKSQTITLPLNALVDNPSAHRMARVEIMSVDRDERAYSNNEFTVYLGGAPELRYDSEITGEIDRDGKHLVFTSVVQALAGETVTMRAYPVGGVKPYQYQWWMYDPDTGKWAQLKNGGAVSGVDTDTLKLQHVRPEWSGRRAVCVITDSAGNTFPDPADWIRYAITLQITGSDDELPDTGDHSNLPLYLAIALAALALLWWTRRKRA
jgi:LPXTG-motif cell wall-anchored protein